jgi:four helix bundle protein
MTNDQWPMTNGRSVMSEMTLQRRNGSKAKYDLAERTAKFAENVIRFALKIPQNSVTNPLITQLVKAGTSVGANYDEAEEAESKKDFRHKICICRKESRESKFWLRMITVAAPRLRDNAAILWQEAKELHLIFCKIVNSCDGKAANPRP